MLVATVCLQGRSQQTKNHKSTKGLQRWDSIPSTHRRAWNDIQDQQAATVCQGDTTDDMLSLR